MKPTELPTVQANLVHRDDYVAFQFSVLPYENDSTTTATNSYIENRDWMVRWFLQQFLCSQASELLWLANPMDILKTKCRQEAIALDDASSYIILWNEPIVSWYPELLEGHIPYEAWNIQYPLYANRTQNEVTERDVHNESVQDRLQALLNDHIELKHLQLIRGLVSIVGKESETHLLRNLGSHTQAPTVLPQTPPILGAYSPESLVLTGALIALIHTLILLLIHIYFRPCLQERNEMKGFEQRMTKSNHQSLGDHPLPSFLSPSSPGDTRQISLDPRQDNTLLADAPAPSIPSTPMPNDDDSGSFLSLSRSCNSEMGSSNQTYDSANNMTAKEDVEDQSLVTDANLDYTGNFYASDDSATIMSC
ncbi:unnamed protein product [Cylindrotheca closterium]|uniref:Uncharacterized protein n=1 Tax=Cylindrotheca closterium TaxID=2856 RepID=A0AAD2JK05_9STRA|nr:unnamed protein product [Cylindrotheca closterium]